MRRASGCERYGGIHDFNPDTIMNVAKVHVCEQQRLDPRRIMVFGEDEVLIPIKRWAERGFKGKPPRTFDPTKSFRENGIRERERFWLVDDPSSYAICPICMEERRPEIQLEFHCLTFQYHCKRCNWHWEVTAWEDGRINVEDEMVYVILHAPFGTIHRRLPTNMRVGQAIEAIVRRSCGVRGELSRQIIMPEEIRVFDGQRELRKDLSFADQGLHYFASLDTQEKLLRA